MLACQLPAAVAEEQARQVMARSLESLIARYHLTEEDVGKQITDEHIEVISRSTCRKWRSLYAHLDLSSIAVDDVDHLPVDEDQKRFTSLKEKKGSEATYKKLISALLTTECREDAECVCKLLKSLQQQQQQPQSTGSAVARGWLMGLEPRYPSPKVINYLCADLLL